MQVSESQTEQWNYVKGYPNYWISTLGTIENRITDEILEHKVNKKGEHKVTLSNKGQRKTFLVNDLLEIAKQYPLGGDDDEDPKIPKKKRIKKEKVSLLNYYLCM